MRCRRWNKNVWPPTRQRDGSISVRPSNRLASARKHRGIIAGLARNRANLNLPAEYEQFLRLYLS